MLVYRIASCQYINDLSGNGAALYGGRWNSKNVYIVYTADNPALSLLEAVVHFGKMPEAGYCMVTLELPDHCVEFFPLNRLPADWNQNPAPDNLKIIGDEFIRAGKFLGLKVPSALMPEVGNILINPAHKDFDKVKIINKRILTIDKRLLQAVGRA